MDELDHGDNKIVVVSVEEEEEAGKEDEPEDEGKIKGVAQAVAILVVHRGGWLGWIL